MGKRTRTALMAGVLAVGSAVTGIAAAAPANAAPPFICQTAVTHGGETGEGTCRNDGTETGQFRVHVVCGLAVDQYSSWVLLAPGQTATTNASCPFNLPGQGVGRITIEFA
ncbi:hypothetical protein [Streptomyces sp. NPDC053542]|uniref:hypothetical protein n=1 Tax=Streptomyces sp. NPDC053542 TaxID=3365710 RepID=UPI0037D7E6B2